jgi:glucokinase
MSTYRDLTHRGSARATVLRTVGTRERRSHLTAPRVPTVGIDIGGTKVMAGVVDADGNILEKLRTETPDKSKSPRVVEDTIVELVLDLSDRHDVHAVGIGAAGWVDADRNCPGATSRCGTGSPSGSPCRSWSTTTPTPPPGPSGASAPAAARTTSS